MSIPNWVTRKFLFWLAVAFVLVGVIYSIVSDTIRVPVECPSQDSKPAAILVLRGLDTSSRRIKASLLISSFNPKEQSLEVDSVSPGSDPDTTNYEPDLLVKPNPSPTPNTAQVPQPDRPWNELNIAYDSHSFLYPFEKYVLNLQINYKGQDNKPIPVKVTIVNQIDEAIIVEKCVSAYSFDPSSNDLNSFHFVLERHRFIRATAGLLYLVALCFLYYIWRREETSKVLTNSLGYLAALWGIRGIVVGPTRLFPTAVDFATLALYVAVVVILAYKLLFPSHPKKEEHTP